MPYQIRKKIGKDALILKKRVPLVIRGTGVGQSHPEKTGTDPESLDQGLLIAVVEDDGVDPVIVREIAPENGNQLSESLGLLRNFERTGVNVPAQQVLKGLKSFWRELSKDPVHHQMAIIGNGIVIHLHLQTQVYSLRKRNKNFMKS